MLRPEIWTIERVVNLMAGAVVFGSLVLGHEGSRHRRLPAGFVGVNLFMDAAVGWSPSSVGLHRLGVPTAAEQALGRDSVGRR